VSLNLDAILELLKQHVSPAARRVPPGWEILAREAHRQGVIDGRAIQMESTSQYDAAHTPERADAEKDAALTDGEICDIWLRTTGFDQRGVDQDVIGFARAILAAKEKK
jgi:hypothetical protein